ncbi:FHA domain-containing protein [Luteimonas huabeiensis]|uniref:FHA domain-containing protein n=1 Tax=Luteimonas huabeiensis TaxID=1244513 RepID=UPI000467D3AE|nr:FHA domain-containing protein [Luteimonas huabeiensis]
METLRLRFSDGEQPDLPLEAGVHGLGRAPHGGIAVVSAEDALARLCVDGRGVWLSVAEGRRGVHVNGRAVQRLAMLRRGDTLHLEGAELRLLADAPVDVPSADADAPAAEGDAQRGLQTVLRGIGGRHHGRSFTLDRPRLVGSIAEADIRIDDPAFAERHARLELRGERVLLRDLGSAEGSVVNGEPVRDALLQPGDQIVFDAHHRFVVEAPMARGASARAPELPDIEIAPAANGASQRRPWRLPWLLLAALAIAGLLSLLLLYGVG